jgi:hypothetical protein
MVATASVPSTATVDQTTVRRTFGIGILIIQSIREVLWRIWSCSATLVPRSTDIVPLRFKNIPRDSRRLIDIACASLENPQDMLNVSTHLVPRLINIVEVTVMIASGVVVAVCKRGTSIPGLALLRKAYGQLARRKTWSIVAVGLLALGMRAAVIPILGVPQPYFHDEFCYLLSADTFLHGRLTNPTHPMWVHFETFHVIQQPSYSSMYPPAEGLVLAAGQLMGHPWIGEWLITGLMCSAICWMLQAWLPPAWALYGAILVALRLAVLSYWINGYWSSALVALGGAMVLGALPRIKKHQRIRDAIWMALGLAILANSRPFEGFLLGVTVGVALLIWMVGPKRATAKIILVRIMVPITLLLGIVGVATGYFYYRVTGSPFRMTYQIDSQIYNPVPYFLWQTPQPEPQYRHAVLREFYEDGMGLFREHHTLWGFWRYVLHRMILIWAFYLRPIATIPLFAAAWLKRDRRMYFPLIACGVLLVALMTETWFLPHYLAPITGLLFLILAQCSRHLAVWNWRNRPLGNRVVQAIPLLLFGTLVLRIGAVALHSPPAGTWPNGNLERAAVVSSLEKMPGKQLVIVDYSAKHNPEIEWVYNAADIDGSKVVWARDMGTHDNQELLQYFHDRQVWALEVNDGSPPQISHYPTGLSAH